MAKMNMKISVLEVDSRRPNLAGELWKNHIQSFHAEMLNGNKQIDLLEIQNDPKIPCTLGDNKNRRQT